MEDYMEVDSCRSKIISREYYANNIEDRKVRQKHHKIAGIGTLARIYINSLKSKQHKEWPFHIPYLQTSYIQNAQKHEVQSPNTSPPYH